MQLVIATDIFGAQPHVLTQFDQWTTDYLSVQAYDHQPPAFKDESEAYSYFLAHGGMEAYCTKLGNVLQAQTQPVFLVGFSAGAAACWANLIRQNLTIVRFVGFYGGQIRHMTQLQPLYPTELIFSEETHFSVSELMHSLSDKINLKQSCAPYPHGFMNQLSQGYRHEVALAYFSLLSTQLNMESALTGHQ